MENAKIDYIITCTYRSQEEQDMLYAQGRTLPGKKVTNAKVSKHTSRTAFDIVIMVNGKPCWDVSNPSWKLAGEIGEIVGLTWGGNFKKFKDFPHFEFNG